MKLFIVPSWYPTPLHPESGSFFRDWARILTDKGHDVTIIAHSVHSFKDLSRYVLRETLPSLPAKDGQLNLYHSETINLYPKFPRLSFRSYARQLTQLCSQALQNQGAPDLVFIHSSLWAGAALAPWLKERDLPAMVAEHLKEFLESKGITEFQYRSIHRSYTSARKIIVPSQALESAVLSRFPAANNKTVVLPHPVDTDLFQLKKHFPESPRSFTFISLALMRSEKRIDLLIEAFSRLVPNQRGVKLTLIGDGPERDRLYRQVTSLDLNDHVDFLGYLPHARIVDILNEGNALVMTSDHETFGMALVEAMACGLPLIATRCGGPEDIVTEETGVLVPKNDVVLLTQAMESMIRAGAQYDRRRIRELAMERFSAGAYVKGIEGLYEEIQKE